MSLDQILLLPPGYGFDSVGEPDVVFTLTLDNLSTRFNEYTGAAASIKFKLTTTDGGGSKTTSTFVYLDSSQGSGLAASALDAIGDVATLIQTKLNALAGYSGVTVDGVATVPGDQWDFTITFPGALGVTDLAFHASSQWYPTITLVEAVQQQGQSNEPATNAIMVFSVLTASDGDHTASNGTDSITVSSSGGIISSIAALPSGWTLSANGVGTEYADFTFDTTGSCGAAWSLVSGNAGYGFTDGTDEVVGLAEIHTITPTPTNPTGGTYSLCGSPFGYDDENPTFMGNGWDTISKTSGTSLAGGAIGFTNGLNGDIADDSLSPVNIDLTAPEIPHSIS